MTIPPWVFPAIGFGLGFFGSKKKSRLEARILRENAADLRELAAQNADAYRYAGEVNADAVLRIGEANAVFTERETERSIQMYALEAGEARRQHILSEKFLAGQIRAGSPIGLQVNTGSPLHYLHSQVKLGIQNRRYGDLKTYWSIRNMFESGEDKASVIRLTAEENARVIQTNAAIQAEMSLADAERQAAAMERGAGAVASMSTFNALSAGINTASSFAGFGSMFTPAPSNYTNVSIGGPHTWGGGWQGQGTNVNYTHDFGYGRGFSSIHEYKRF